MNKLLNQTQRLVYAKVSHLRLFALCIMVFALSALPSCLTYYQRNMQFSQAFEQGRLADAAHLLDKDKKATRRNTKLLYYLNRGTLDAIMGNYAASNNFFEDAYNTGEDYQKNYWNEAAALLTNPKVTPYKGESHELLLIHYYKALNYLKLGQPEKALVECRRMDIKLHQLSDKYTSARKYKRDAFIHNLMGIIYDANGDANNAFIAYRNAYEIYRDDYKQLFNLDVPHQLKQDLIRAAYQTGFVQEAKSYEKIFGIKYQPIKKNEGELVFIWHNGLGPVKDEWGLNFTIVRGAGNNVTFYNAELGLSFSFYLEPHDKEKSQGLSALEFIRVAFPKYVERPLVYNRAQLSWGANNYTLELAENVNAIAFKSLKDRMLTEFGKSLLRVALKKATEYKMRKENQGAGALLGIVNAITEQADTRNWQTIPHSIYYTRLALPEGQQTIQFKASAVQPYKDASQSFNIPIKAGQVYFQTNHNLDYKRTIR